MTTQHPAGVEPAAETCRRCGRPLIDPLAVHDRLGQKCRRRWLLEGDPADDRTAPGALLRHHRDQRGLSTAEVAARAGIDRRTLQRGEAGTRPLGPRAIDRVAQVLDPGAQARLRDRYVTAVNAQGTR
jgi:hypothetical protein